MMPSVRTVFITLVTAAAVVASLAAEVRFTSTWKHIDAGTVNFAGKKVAALVISKDDSLRIAGEESLVRALTARGLQTVAAYRIAPKEELRGEGAKPWFEKAAIEGVVAIRPVSVESQRYGPTTWSTPYYSTLWGYYGYGWTTVFVPGRTETKVVVETLIYSVPLNTLLWAGATETTNARDLPSFVQELVKETVEVLHEQGLARRVAK